MKGMSKPKAQEKFNTKDYLVTGQAGVPNVPSTQATVLSLEDGVPIAIYQEPPTESPAIPQTQIQVDKLGFNVELSYDVELPQEFQYDQVPTVNAYPGPSTNYPACDSRTPSDDYYPPPYPQLHPATYNVAINNHLPPSPPQPFFGPRVSPEYLGSFHLHAPNSPSGSPGMPHQHGFVEAGFGMRVPQQFQQPQQQQFHYIYQSNVDFNHMHQPALAAF